MRSKILITFMLSIPAWLVSCYNSHKISSVDTIPQQNKNNPSISFYSLKATTIDGQTVSMEKYKGKKVVIINTASKCGYTPQYADWQSFHKQYGDSIVVLGFPCNQFMFQEPGSASEISTFCEKNYGVTFQMFDKVDVKGDDASEVYKWLTKPELNGWNSDVPSWNFCKYVIDENGNLTHFFASKITPTHPEFVKAVL
jgi:glutathione peroxidase